MDVKEEEEEEDSRDEIIRMRMKHNTRERRG
jgi:hypothetical protein